MSLTGNSSIEDNKSETSNDESNNETTDKKAVENTED